MDERKLLSLLDRVIPEADSSLVALPEQIPKYDFFKGIVFQFYDPMSAVLRPITVSRARLRKRAFTILNEISNMHCWEFYGITRRQVSQLLDLIQAKSASLIPLSALATGGPEQFGLLVN